MPTNNKPAWISRQPHVGDIVTCLYPNDPKGRLRPCLVLGVAKGSAGSYAVHIAYGTTNLNKEKRSEIDLIVDSEIDIKACGIPSATRFDLENTTALVWEQPDFDCWKGRYSPRLGSLPKNKQTECGWKLKSIKDKGTDESQD
jgi:hypothetical protein